MLKVAGYRLCARHERDKIVAHVGDWFHVRCAIGVKDIEEYVIQVSTLGGWDFFENRIRLGLQREELVMG